MKKFLILVFTFIFVQIQAFSAHSYTCANIPETKNNALNYVGKITGYDFLVVQAAEAYLQHYIKKNFDADVKLNIKAKSVKALKNGEFREVTAKSKKLNCGSFTVSDFQARTLCPCNKIAQRGDLIVFPYDVPAEFSAVITNDDLQSIAVNEKNSRYAFGIKSINWKIENSRLKVFLEFKALLADARVTFSTGLKVDNGMVSIIYPSGINSPVHINVNRILPYLNINSPFSSVIKLTHNAFSYLDYDYIEIVGDKIYVKGMFLIPQNCDIKK